MPPSATSSTKGASFRLPKRDAIPLQIYRRTEAEHHLIFPLLPAAGSRQDAPGQPRGALPPEPPHRSSLPALRLHDLVVDFDCRAIFPFESVPMGLTTPVLNH